MIPLQLLQDDISPFFGSFTICPFFQSSDIALVPTPCLEVGMTSQSMCADTGEQQPFPTASNLL